MPSYTFIEWWKTMTFEVSDVELKNAEDWLANHVCKEKDKRTKTNKRVAIPVSATSYKFTQTSVGSLVSVVCICGLEHDITDVSMW